MLKYITFALLTTLIVWKKRNVLTEKRSSVAFAGNDEEKHERRYHNNSIRKE